MSQASLVPTNAARTPCTLQDCIHLPLRQNWPLPRPFSLSPPSPVPFRCGGRTQQPSALAAAAALPRPLCQQKLSQQPNQDGNRQWHTAVLHPLCTRYVTKAGPRRRGHTMHAPLKPRCAAQNNQRTQLRALPPRLCALPRCARLYLLNGTMPDSWHWSGTSPTTNLTCGPASSSH